MTQYSYWDFLGIAPTADTKIIRRQYATLLKKIDQKTHPEQFQQLREAYERALNEASWLAKENSQAAETSQTTDSPQEPEQGLQVASASNDLSLTERHVGIWIDSIVAKLNQGDNEGAIQVLHKNLASPIYSRQEIRDLFQRQIAHLCMSAEKVPYAFVEAAADKFCWFDPVIQGKNFDLEIIRDLRARMLQQDASIAAEKFKELSEPEALSALQEQLQSHRLQGLQERDYFEICLLVQIVHHELSLSAMQLINTTLHWDKENRHLWNAASQACEAFGARLNQLKSEQEHRDFESYLNQLAEDRSEAGKKSTSPKEIWFYRLLPFLLGGIVAFIFATNGLEAQAVVISSLLCIAGCSALIFFFNLRVNRSNFPRAEVRVAQSILSPYKPFWLRWRAFRESHQLRVKEWLKFIADNHPHIMETLEPKTLAFWNESHPCVNSSNLGIRLLFTLPISISILTSILSTDWVNERWVSLVFPATITLTIIAMACQIYLLSALSLLIKPIARSINQFLARHLLPKRFSTLSSSGISFIILLLVSTLIGSTSAGIFFLLSAENSKNIWIACCLVFPATSYGVAWVYLWHYQRKINQLLEQGNKTSGSGFSFRWWHWFFIMALLRAVSSITNP